MIIMKLLYLTTWDFTNEEADGVCKKIHSQIAVFKERGFEVDFIYIKNNRIIYRECNIDRIIGKVGNIKKTPAYIKMYKELKDKQYHWVYNRYGMMDTFYYRVLKRLFANGAKILIEVPTYPYIGEQNKGILFKIMFWWDSLYQKRLRKIVNRIVTFSRDEKIFNIRTIQTMNGIDVSLIKPISRINNEDDTIDLLMVALMQPYHGYERLLYGIKKYYENGGTREIMCHFVGDGPEKKVYENIAKECKLEDKVRFYGMVGGEKLDDIYNYADIGVCSLGCYKKGIYLTSELKAREYLAKGLPIIAGTDIDIFSKIEKKYYLSFSNDKSIININSIVEFYDNVYKEGNQATMKAIREMAEKYISMEAVMEPVYDYMNYQGCE